MNGSGMNGSEKRTFEAIVRFFGPLEEVLGTPEETLTLSYPQSDASLRGSLEAAFPGLKGRVYSIAVDQAIVAEGQTIREAREIALLPPFAGG